MALAIFKSKPDAPSSDSLTVLVTVHAKARYAEFASAPVAPDHAKAHYAEFVSVVMDVLDTFLAYNLVVGKPSKQQGVHSIKLNEKLEDGHTQNEGSYQDSLSTTPSVGEPSTFSCAI